MIKDKKDVRAIINKYMDINGDAKALGFINYHAFNARKIKEDFEAINDFFRKNFKLNQRTIRYVDLTFDEEDNMWLSIETIDDIELLDELIAFAIASGVLKENLVYRYNEGLLRLDNIVLINEDPRDLEQYSEGEYIRAIKRNVLTSYHLDVSEETRARYKKEIIRRVYSPERKKELLMAWWDRGVANPETREVFSELLDQSIGADLILFVYKLYKQGLTSANLSEIISRGDLITNLLFLHAVTFRATEEAKKEIEEDLNEMFDRFDDIEKDKKRHL